MADKTVAWLTSSTPTVDDLTVSYDNADTSELKKTTWQSVRDLFKTYFDTIYATLSWATFTGDVNVPDEIYGSWWNGSTEVPTKNALYDKIETLWTGNIATDPIWDAKGDIAVGTGANTASRLPVGSNGQVLTADSGEATGTKWSTISGTWDVSSSSNITDNAIVRGDGWAKWVQSSGVTLSDANSLWNVNSIILDTSYTGTGEPASSFLMLTLVKLWAVPSLLRWGIYLGLAARRFD